MKNAPSIRPPDNNCSIIPSTDLLNTINRIAVVNMYTAGILSEITFLITRYAAPINIARVETSPIQPPIFPINISNKAGFSPPDKTVAADTAEIFLVLHNLTYFLTKMQVKMLLLPKLGLQYFVLFHQKIAYK